jgi:hypothetical protein
MNHKHSSLFSCGHYYKHYQEPTLQWSTIKVLHSVGSGFTCKQLGWKGLPETNTLAYYGRKKYSSIIVQAPRVIWCHSVLTGYFRSQIYNCDLFIVEATRLTYVAGNTSFIVQALGAKINEVFEI